MQEYRRLIEDQMEKFRELEKEYKQKKLTKVVYQNHNEIESKYMFDSGDSDGEPRDYNDYDESLSEGDSHLEGEPTPKIDKSSFIAGDQESL